MGIIGKLEIEVEIKSCGDLFHELFGQKPHHLSNIVPDMIHSCDVHEGEFGQPGSVIFWNYTLDGKKYVKEVVEAIDNEEKSIRCKVVEGDVLVEYKSMTICTHVIPKGDTAVVKWAIEFEKIHDDGPYPTKIMDFAIKVTKDIEAHHLAA